MTRIVAIIFFAGLLITQQQGAISQPAEAAGNCLFSGMNWQDGDIVLREGNGVISNFMKATSRREERFSHAGIVLITKSGPRVFHVIGTSENPEGGLAADTPEDFCDRQANKSFMVVRYPLLQKQKEQLRREVAATSRNTITFDKDFDLQTEQAYYCTEFIFKMIQKSTGYTNWIPVSETTRGTYIGLDDLYLNATAKKLIDQTL